MFEALIQPTVTDAMLVSSSAVVEDSAPAWVSGTTYALNAEVRRSSTHRVYRDSVGGVSNVAPEVDTTRWQNRRPTNLWAMFDARVATATKLPSPFVVTLQAHMITALVLLAIDGAWDIEVTYRATPGGAIVPLPGSDPVTGVLTQSLEASAPGDWWEYFFSPLRPASDFLIRNIEPYVEGEITVKLTGDSGDVSVGLLAIGDLFPMGETAWGARSKTVDYSYIDLNADKENVIVPGPGARDLAITAYIEKSEANAVERVLNDIRGKPCVVIGSNLPEHEGLRTFGLVNAEVSYDNVKDAAITGTVRGLV